MENEYINGDLNLNVTVVHVGQQRRLFQSILGMPYSPWENVCWHMHYKIYSQYLGVIVVVNSDMYSVICWLAHRTYPRTRYNAMRLCVNRQLLMCKTGLSSSSARGELNGQSVVRG